MSKIHEQLPAYHYFQVGNGYTGSIGKNKYKIKTDKGEGKIFAYVYDCPYCFEIALEQEKILHTEEFELSPQGFEACKSWLAERVEAVR